MANNTNYFIGYFSKAAAEMCGTVIYEDENGKEVEVTSVVPANDDYPSKWDDAVKVATNLTKYLRKGSPFRFHEMLEEDHKKSP